MIHDTAPVRLETVWLWPDGTTAPIVSGGADEGDGGGGGGTDGAQGEGGTGQGGESGQGDGQAPAAKKFTQEQVNAALAKHKRELLADLPDAAELRRKAKAFDQLEEAGRSELDKAVARATAAEAAVEAANTRANGVLKRAAIVVAARDTVDPDAVFEALASDASITVDDDGTVAGVEEAIAALLERRPYLKAGNGGQGDGGNAGTNAGNGNGNGGQFDGGARGGGGETLTQKHLATMPAAEIAKLTPEQVAAAMGRP